MNEDNKVLMDELIDSQKKFDLDRHFSVQRLL